MTGEQKKKEYIKIKLSDLIPYERNNKKHWLNVDEIVKSIKANTYITPIVVDENNIILAGHWRKLALEKMWETDADVLVVTGLTETQKRDFRIRDNKLTELSERDFDNLKIELEELDIPELSDLFKDVEELEEEVEAKEDDYEIPEVITTDIVLWDLFEIGEHRLLCGDSTKIDTFERLMQGELADMVVTDPPYNVDYKWKTKESLTIDNDSMHTEDFYSFLFDFYSSLKTVVKKWSPIYIWHAHTEIVNFWKAMIDAWWLLKQQLIWVKNTMVMGRQDYQWKHEPCLYWWLAGDSHKRYSDRKQTTVIDYDRPSRNGEHPTMKPIGLFSYQIENSSKQGDIVIDAFWWSGTAMLACEQINRKARVIEFDPKYCQVIIDRMIRLNPELTIKKNWAERDHATGDYTLLSS